MGACCLFRRWTDPPVMGDVAADEHAAERHRGAHHNETAGGRIDDQVAGVRDGADQAIESAERRNSLMDSRYDWPAL
jgi:hypothetical protein